MLAWESGPRRLVNGDGSGLPAWITDGDTDRRGGIGAEEMRRIEEIDWWRRRGNYGVIVSDGENQRFVQRSWNRDMRLQLPGKWGREKEIIWGEKQYCSDS